jgi:hypothetical protein
MRRLVYLSNGLLTAAAIVFAVTVGTGWSWWLFVWGAALGVLGVVGNELLARVTLRVLRPAATDVERLRSRRHDQRLIVFPSALITGCAIGIIAAGLQSAIPDALMTVAVVVFEVGLPLAMLRLLRRRVAALGTQTASSSPSTDE